MTGKSRDLLVEIGTEELPPRALAALAEDFHDRLCAIIHDQMELFETGEKVTRYYYSPRRLAIIFENLRMQQPDRKVDRFGPAINVAFDNDGKPTKAAEGFARSCDTSVDRLEQKDGKLFFSTLQAGLPAGELVPQAVNEALTRLSIPKRMRWGSGSGEFVRPVHWVVMLHGKDVIDGEILGVRSGRYTRGHRFHHPEPVELKSPADYVSTLRKNKVWLNDAAHELQAEISSQARKLADEVNADPLNSDVESPLVAEIAALVEWPVPLRGEFDPKFLALPEEILVATMEDQQRYFPLRDKKTGKLAPSFIAIANIASRDEKQIRQGNERVIVPRLADAMFFWDNDRSVTLDSRFPELDGITFQEKLGSIGDKCRRVARLVTGLSEILGMDPALSLRAAQLSRCDLVTSLVGEFPELQGTIGRYLAMENDEPAEVATAIEEFYRPRFAGDRVPDTEAGQVLALADKLDTLAGIFGIGQQPTGDKDPFALRRTALGIIRILVECRLPLLISDLVHAAFAGYDKKIDDRTGDVITFLFDRARGYFAEEGYTANEIEAVLHPYSAEYPARIDRLADILMAVRNYNNLPEADSLSAANKRIGNILKKLDAIPSGFDMELLTEDAEKQLAEQYLRIAPEINKLREKQEFTAMLQQLAILKEPVDQFFDKVMVMTDDQALRNNRVGLLKELHAVMNQIADLSRLAA